MPEKRIIILFVNVLAVFVILQNAIVTHRFMVETPHEISTQSIKDSALLMAFFLIIFVGVIHQLFWSEEKITPFHSFVKNTLIGVWGTAISFYLITFIFYEAWG